MRFILAPLTGTDRLVQRSSHALSDGPYESRPHRRPTSVTRGALSGHADTHIPVPATGANSPFAARQAYGMGLLIGQYRGRAMIHHTGTIGAVPHKRVA